MTTWKIPVESPVSLNLEGSGSKADASVEDELPFPPMVVVAASESYSTKSSVYDSAVSLSLSKSGSIKVKIISEPIK